MATEVIQKVTEIEEMIRKQKEEAMVSGKQQVLEAQRAARQLLETSRQEAEGQVRQMMTEAEQKAASWTQDVLATARQECEEQKQQARAKLDQAAAFLMEKVVNI